MEAKRRPNPEDPLQTKNRIDEAPMNGVDRTNPIFRTATGNPIVDELANNDVDLALASSIQPNRALTAKPDV